MNPFDFEGKRRQARHDAENKSREAARKRSAILEENRVFAWAWASESDQQAAGFDAYSANPVVPVGWPPGTDPSMDVTALKEPPKIAPAAENAGNPWG